MTTKSQTIKYVFYPASTKPKNNNMLLVQAKNGTWIGTYDDNVDGFFEEQWGEEIADVVAWAVLRNSTAFDET